MRKVFVAAWLACLCAPGALAQTGGERAALMEVVETERAFSRASVERGMRDAFIAFSAEDGVIFRNTPLNSRKFWTERPPAPGLLTWRPTYADIARAGDMGYTFGPWEFRSKTREDQPTGHGHFVTVWRKQADGTWKFAADIGISHAPPAVAQELQLAPAPRGRAPRAADADAERAALLKLERDFSDAATARGTTDAYRAYLTNDARLFRPDAAPYAGRAAALAALATRKGALRWQAAHADVSRSADLGYTYGTYEFRGAGDDPSKPERGHFMRVWKRQPGGPWRVVLDITNAIKP